MPPPLDAPALQAWSTAPSAPASMSADAQRAPSATARAGRRTALSPTQHAALRRQLVLIPIYMWCLYGWWTFATELPFASARAQNVRDFAHFYVQGVIAHSGPREALYDIDAHQQTLRRVVPGGDVRFPPVYGPQVAAFFSPLARLTYSQALYTWILVSMLVYGVAALALWRASPGLHTQPGTAAVLFLAAPPFHFLLGFSQVSVIGLTAIALATLALRRDRKVLAGCAIGILAYKPPLGLALAFVMVASREWRIVGGAVAAAGVQLLLGFLYWGPGVLSPYVHTLTRLSEIAPTMEPFKFQMHSWRAFFELLGAKGHLVTAGYLAMSAMTLALALTAWRSRGPLALRWSAVLLATVLVDPHLYVYDLLILIPAFVLAWEWTVTAPTFALSTLWRGFARLGIGAWSVPVVVGALLYSAYFAPLFSGVSLLLRVQPSVPLMTALLAACAWVLKFSRSAQPHAAP